jgi:1,4-alpha-glucan branching enzyme
MPASQQHVTDNTPMGANLIPGGATFRVFAPNARAVYINGIFDGVRFFPRDADDSLLLVRKNNDWTEWH